MFSFDMSTTNVLLTVAVVGLFVLFIVLLMKLNPSTDNHEDSETDVRAERQRLHQTLPIAPQDSQQAGTEVPRAAERPVVAAVSTVGGSSVQARQETVAPAALDESKDILRSPERTVAPAKKGFAPARKDCLHHFGYLRTFPKNSPIPDECFGCEKIVDCLVNKKSK